MGQWENRVASKQEAKTPARVWGWPPPWYLFGLSGAGFKFLIMRSHWPHTLHCHLHLTSLGSINGQPSLWPLVIFLFSLWLDNGHNDTYISEGCTSYPTRFSPGDANIWAAALQGLVPNALSSCSPPQHLLYNTCCCVRLGVRTILSESLPRTTRHQEESNNKKFMVLICLPSWETAAYWERIYLIILPRSLVLYKFRWKGSIWNLTPFPTTDAA